VLLYLAYNSVPHTYVLTAAFAQTAMELSCLCLMVFVFTHPESLFCKFLRSDRMRGVGKISYYLYLVHWGILWMIVRFVLRGNEVLRNFLDGSAKLRTITGLQSERRGFRPFVNVEVGIDRATLRRGVLPDETANIVHAAVGFQKFFHRRNTFVDVDVSSLRPETMLDGDGVRMPWSRHGGVLVRVTGDCGPDSPATILAPVNPARSWPPGCRQEIVAAEIAEATNCRRERLEVLLMVRVLLAAPWRNAR